MMAVDGSVVLAGGRGDNHYWAYGEQAEQIHEEKDGGTDTLWYMAGPDDYVLKVPANIEKVRIATVVARNETAKDGEKREGKQLRIVAHPDSPIEFETSERVVVHVQGSNGDDVMIGPKYSGAEFHGGEGNDKLIARSKRGKDRNVFYGGAGNDTLLGGAGRDYLDGGTGNDLIHGNHGNNTILGGHGNDTIHDGPGSSEIHTGPGRNTIVCEEGDDVIFVGNGENTITGGSGAMTYRFAYGGLTRLIDWKTGDSLDFSSWPLEPSIDTYGADVEIWLGASVVVLHNVSDIDSVRSSCKMPNKASQD